MPRSILDTLPADLAFLKPAVRRMLIVHEANRPPADADMEPEEARDSELEASSGEDTKLLGEALRAHFDGADRDAFVGDVRAVQSRLLKWLGPHKRRPLTPETSLLFTIVGLLGYPESYVARARPRKKAPPRKKAR